MFRHCTSPRCPQSDKLLSIYPCLCRYRLIPDLFRQRQSRDVRRRVWPPSCCFWGLRLSCAKISPTDLGYPCSRPRQFSILCLKGVVELAEDWSNFMDTFARKVVASPQLLFQQTPEYAAKILMNKASKRGWVPPNDDLTAQPRLTDAMPPGQKKNYHEYEGMRSQFQHPVDGSFYYDFEQNPKFGSKGALIPCLLSHGHLVEATSQQLAGGLTHLAIMGEAVFERHLDDNPFKEAWPHQEHMRSQDVACKQAIQ